MAKTIVGLYDHIQQARDTVEDLVDAGFDRDRISFTANAAAEEYGRYFDDEGGYRDDVDYEEHDMTAGEGAAAGAGIGATVGGIGGLLMGLGLLAIPGVGPALAAGPIVSALVGAGIGAAAGGLMGALVNAGVPEEHAGYYAEGVRRGGSLVMLTTDEDRVGEVERIMNKHNPVDLDERVENWREAGFTEFDREADPYDADAIRTERDAYVDPYEGRVDRADVDRDVDANVDVDRDRVATGSDTIEVVEEDVRVGKREVSGGGKRIRSYVVENPVEESVTLRDEKVTVDRHPVDREVTDADAAFQDKTVEMTETHEEAVVDKRARVVEEVAIGKEASEHTETIHETERHTEIEIEDIDTDVTTSAYTDDRDHYREHFGTTFGDTGRSYEHYEPAYRFGSRLANEDAAGNMAWDSLEADAQRRWEERNPGTWNDYGDAVRYSYEREHNRA